VLTSAVVLSGLWWCLKPATDGKERGVDILTERGYATGGQSASWWSRRSRGGIGDPSPGGHGRGVDGRAIHLLTVEKSRDVEIERLRESRSVMVWSRV
jgi:hypothetical protein